MGLEDDLRKIALEDRRSQDEEKRLFSQSWFELSHAEPGKELQFKKVMQIRRTLNEYSPEAPVYAQAQHRLTGAM